MVKEPSYSLSPRSPLFYPFDNYEMESGRSPAIKYLQSNEYCLNCFEKA